MNILLALANLKRIGILVVIAIPLLFIGVICFKLYNINAKYVECSTSEKIQNEAIMQLAREGQASQQKLKELESAANKYRQQYLEAAKRHEQELIPSDCDGAMNYIKNQNLPS